MQYFEFYQKWLSEKHRKVEQKIWNISSLDMVKLGRNHCISRASIKNEQDTIIRLKHDGLYIALNINFCSFTIYFKTNK